MDRNIFYIDEINNLAKNDDKLLISMSEEMYHDQTTEMVNDIISKENVKIILIAGPSSSGKTTTSKLIRENLLKHNKKSIIVSLDDFFLNRVDTPLLPNGKYDYENITALDLKCFYTFMDNLIENKSAKMPVYNFISGKREDQLVPVNIDSDTYIIIEGLHALNPILTEKHKKYVYKLYLCALSNFNYNDELLINYVDLRLIRRMIRDYYTRGRTIEETLYTWQEVLDGEVKYIDPYKNDVDFTIDSTHMYEPLLYAKYLLPLLEKLDLPITNKLKEKLNKCEKLNKNIIPKNSLLKEFIQF